LGNPGYQTPGQPFTGQAWQNVLAVLLEPAHDAHRIVSRLGPTASRDREYDPVLLLRPSALLERQSYLRLVVGPLADDPNGTAPRWLWETGADYTITQASGEFAGMVGDSLHAFGPFDAPGLAAGTGFLIDVVPEPGTALLFGVGLAGLAAARARRERM
jgi:hypothetical protein